MQISEYIPTGYDNRLSRTQLSIITGLDDRKVRDLISNSKAVIISKDGGYFQPSDDERNLVEEYYRKEQARVRTLAVKLRRLRKYVEYD